MTMTDPIADMPIRLRNVSSAYYELISMPYLEMKAAVANILQAEDYIRNYQAEEARVGKTLVLNLEYGTKRERAISDVGYVSESGLRVRAKSDELPKIMGRLGVAIISSSSGLLADRKAADKGVDEEVIVYI